jgi:hypothetical protein
MAYRKDKQEGWRALRLSEHRELWRDSGSLFQLPGHARERRPECFNWLARLAGEGALPAGRRFSLAVFGLSTDQAKIHFWRQEHMPLPLEYLNDVELVASLQNALGLAEKVGGALRKSVWLMASRLLAPAADSADTDRVRSLVDNIAPERLYWSRLELPFRQFLVRLADNPAEREQEVARWLCHELLPRARDAFDKTAGSLDQSARELRAVTLAGRRLGAELASISQTFREALHEQPT